MAKSRSNIVKLMVDEDNPNGLYEFELPPMPAEKEIWYYDVPKRDQFWKTPSAKNFKWLTAGGDIRNVKHMTERERREYIDYWRDNG